jgi:DNA-binding CsgD family transcriptional regulator
MAERLEAGDLEKILDLVHALSDVGDPDEFLDVSLHGVMDLVPCAVATINEVVPSADRVVGWTRPESYDIPPGAAEALSRLAGDHPLISYMASTGDGSAHRLSDFWTQDEFHRSELYEEVYRPMGVEYQMSVGFPVPRPTVLGLAMSRETVDFSDRDLLALDAMRPHLVQGWQTVRDRSQLKALLNAAQDALVVRDSGLIVMWDPPQELSPGVLLTLYRYFGEPTRASPFPSRVTRWLEAQARVTSSSETGLTLARPLTAQRGGRRAILRYLPARAGHPGAIVVTERSDSSERSGFESLGLTPREAQVIGLVSAGSTNADIAERLGVALGTVKKHLENVYTKLGVHGRAQVVAFAFETLAAGPKVGGSENAPWPPPEASR